MHGGDIYIQSTQYVIGVGTLALINAGLAQSKNRGALLWFFISLFIGPVATFLLVVLDKQAEKKA